MTPRKYITRQDGKVIKNPEWLALHPEKPSTVSNPNKALTIIPSYEDSLNEGDHGNTAEIQLAPATEKMISYMSTPAYMNPLNIADEAIGIDGLGKIFNEYEIPVGLKAKLRMLMDYRLNFLIDDSASMNDKTDATFDLACDATRFHHDKDGSRARNQKPMTRWIEAEDRIHIMIDVLAYIPVKNISLSFLNQTEIIELPRGNLNPEEFKIFAHQKVIEIFNRGAKGDRTPIYSSLKRAFENANRYPDPTFHYVFTDGKPNESLQFNSIDKLVELIMSRNAAKNPINFMSCTGNVEEAQWMKDLDKNPLKQFISELDDFYSERDEVKKAHGETIPFSRGFWIIRQLLDAICEVLDSMDEENRPFTKYSLDDLLGPISSIEEYQFYFFNNPNTVPFHHLFERFAREQCNSTQILHPNLHSQVYSPQSSYGKQNTYSQYNNAYSGPNSGYGQQPIGSMNPYNSGYPATQAPTPYGQQQSMNNSYQTPHPQFRQGMGQDPYQSSSPSPQNFYGQQSSYQGYNTMPSAPPNDQYGQQAMAQQNQQYGQQQKSRSLFGFFKNKGQPSYQDPQYQPNSYRY